MQEHNIMDFDLSKVDMTKYNLATELVARGKKQTEKKMRRCMKCGIKFESAGPRSCDPCVRKNKNFGALIDY